MRKKTGLVKYVLSILTIIVISLFSISTNAQENFRLSYKKFSVPKYDWTPKITGDELHQQLWTVSKDAQKVLKVSEDGVSEVFDTLPPDGSSSWGDSTECASMSTGNSWLNFSEKAVDNEGHFYFVISCYPDINNPPLGPKDYLYKVSPSGNIQSFFIDFDPVPPEYPTIAGAASVIFGPDGNIWVSYNKDNEDSRNYFVRLTTSGQQLDILTSPEPSWPITFVNFNNKVYYTDIRSGTDSFFGSTDSGGIFERILYSQINLGNIFASSVSSLNKTNQIILFGLDKNFSGNGNAPLSLIWLDSQLNISGKKDFEVHFDNFGGGSFILLRVSSTKNGNIVFTALENGLGYITANSDPEYIDPFEDSPSGTLNLPTNVVKSKNYNFISYISSDNEYQNSLSGIIRITESSTNSDQNSLDDKITPPKSGSYYFGLVFLVTIFSFILLNLYIKILKGRSKSSR